MKLREIKKSPKIDDNEEISQAKQSVLWNEVSSKPNQHLECKLIHAASVLQTEA